MKIYSNLSNYHESLRFQLNSISKSFWNELSPIERQNKYGKWVELFEYEPSIDKADICLLTYKWNYYIENNQQDQAQAEIDAARLNQKQIVVFSDGDFPANLPDNDVILFEFGGYKSTPGYRYHSAVPGYIWDYLDTYCSGQVEFRQKTDIPKVGFCGQASVSPILKLYRKALLKQKQVSFKMGKLKWQPPPFETTSFRTKVLREFEGKEGIQTNFILRKKYWAGITNDKSGNHPAKMEYIRNILDSDYTVCMRGGGNFSLRFYEALCLGRIPIFVDTDCLLPFQDEIDYKSIFPWIDVKDLPHAAEILQDFHARLSNDDFIDLQKTCRKLWVDHLTIDGFYTDLHAKLESLI